MLSQNSTEDSTDERHQAQRSTRLVQPRSLVVWGMTVLAPLAAAAAVIVFHNDARSVTDALSVRSIAWSTTVGPSRPIDTTQRETTSVAPVRDLIAGLEQRLDRNPDDAKGWVLLAQSHAFLGNTGRVDAAIARAVALGMNENELRRRVGLAASSNGPESRDTSDGEMLTPVNSMLQAQ